MKVFAIISALILILALVGVGSLYMTANVFVEAQGVFAAEAASQPELFRHLSEQVRLGAVVGTPFVAAAELGDAGGYQLLTYTVRLRNDCRVPADMIELQITPMNGDVLQIGASADVHLAPGGTVDVSATILTDINMYPVRDVVVTYYMWGIPFSLRTTIK